MTLVIAVIYIIKSNLSIEITNHWTRTNNHKRDLWCCIYSSILCYL